MPKNTRLNLPRVGQRKSTLPGFKLGFSFSQFQNIGMGWLIETLTSTITYPQTRLVDNLKYLILII